MIRLIKIMTENNNCNKGVDEMISLIGTDLDGTLFNDQSRISPANRQALRQANVQGIQLAICSGRTLPTVAALFDQTLGVPGYRVCLNGAVIYDLQNQLLQKTALPPQQLLAAFRIAKRWRVRLCICGLEKIWVYQPDLLSGQAATIEAPRLTLNSEAQLKAMLDQGEQFYKFTFNLIHFNFSGIKRAVEAAKQLPLHFVRSGRYFFEATAPGVHKSAALALIADQTKLDMANFMCFGDYENDYEMIRDVGYGVAMGNALPSIKQVAWRQTVDHDRDGVAAILRQLAVAK